MKKQHTTWILVFALLLTAVAYFYFVHSKRTRSFAEADFAITDTTSLTKITFTSVQKNDPKLLILLEKQKDGKWLVNGKYPVLEPQLHYFFETITQLKVQERLSDAANVTADKQLNHSHLRLDYYAGNNLVKSIQLGSEGKAHQGSIMRRSGATQAYIVGIPGFTGFLNARFPVSLQFWRENLLFEGKLSELQTIEVVDNTGKGLAFKWKKNGQAWLLNGKTADSMQVKTYFRNFRPKVYGETFALVNFPNKYNELKDKRPDLVYKLTYTNGRQRSINLFLRPEDKNTFFGWVEGENELLTIQHYTMDRFLNVAGVEQLNF